MFKTIGNYYTRNEFPTAFYEKEFDGLFEEPYEALSEEKKERADHVFTDLLSQWDAKLQAKIIAAQLRVFRDDWRLYCRTSLQLSAFADEVSSRLLPCSKRLMPCFSSPRPSVICLIAG